MPTPVKPTAALVKKYMSSVIGETNPSSAEVAVMLQQWQNIPGAFNNAMVAMKSIQNKKLLGEPSPAAKAAPKASKKTTSGVPSVDFVKDYLKVVSGHANPSVAVIKAATDAWTKDQALYQKAQMQLAKAKANLAKNSKPPGPFTTSNLETIANQTEPQATENEPINDIDVVGLLGDVKQALKKKFNPKDKSWGAGYNKFNAAYRAVETKVKSVKNKSGFLQAVLKIVSSSYVPGKGRVSAKPGEYHALQLPEKEPLSPFAQSMGMTPEKKAKAVALQAKIAEYDALLAKLKAEQKKTATALSKALTDKDKPGGINEKLLKYFSFIEKNCSEYLSAVKEANGKLLFRGQDDASHSVFVAHPRADRKPRDSDPDAQQLIDKYLSALGFKALRSNSLFATSSVSQASEYGTPYAIFPKNGFKFTWSTKHKDLVINSVSDVVDAAEDVDDRYQDWYNKLRFFRRSLITVINNYPHYFGLDQDDDNFEEKALQLEKKTKALPEYKKFCSSIDKYDHLESDHYKVEDLHKAFADVATSFLAFMNKTKFKLLANVEIKQLNQLIEIANKNSAVSGNGKDIKVKAAKVIKNFGFVQNNLPAALKAEHEVMIIGEYIAVNYRKFRDEINQYFVSPNQTAKKK